MTSKVILRTLLSMLIGAAAGGAYAAWAKAMNTG